MIKKKDNYLEWIQLIDELSEAKEHLEKVIRDMDEIEDYDESYFSVDISHIYVHINRAWNCRSSKNGIVEEDWNKISKFPKDIDPIG